MRSSLPASWATTQIDPKPAATPSGPAPVLIVAVTSPVAGSSRSSSLPWNDVTHTAPYAAVVRSGTPGTSTVRSGAVAPAGIRATVSPCAATTQTLPSSVAVSPTGPGSTSTYGATGSTAASVRGRDVGGAPAVSRRSPPRSPRRRRRASRASSAGSRTMTER